MASTTGWRVNGLTAPSATRKPAVVAGSPRRGALAIAVTNVTASRSK